MAIYNQTYMESNIFKGNQSQKKRFKKTIFLRNAIINKKERKLFYWTPSVPEFTW